MRRFFQVFSGILLLLFVNMGFSADRILPDTAIKVGVITGSAPDYKRPFVSQTTSGELSGIAVDMWKAVARESLLSFRFIRIESNYQQAIADLRSGKYDVLVGAISKTKERMQIVTFSKPFFTNHIKLLVKKDQLAEWNNHETPIKERLHDKKILVVKNTSLVTLAKTFSKNVIESDNQLSAMQALNNGEADVFLGDGVMMALALNNHPEWDLQILDHSLKTDPYAFVVPKNSPHLKAIDTAISQMSQENLQTICAVYQSVFSKDIDITKNCQQAP